MEIKKTTWLEDFDETRRDILDALSAYLTSGGEFTQGERGEYLPQVFRRLCGYLSQHALELHRLEERLGAELP